eukprot:3195167-Amphidinium_carterae.1
MGQKRFLRLGAQTGICVRPVPHWFVAWEFLDRPGPGYPLDSQWCDRSTPISGYRIRVSCVTCATTPMGTSATRPPPKAVVRGSSRVE